MEGYERAGQAYIKNVTIYDRLTTATLDVQARTNETP
jgi:hypothetical protein